MIKAEDIGIPALIASALSLGMACCAAYGTHIWWIIWLLMAGETAPNGKIVIAVLGIVFPPFGMIHGGYLWFNHW